MTSPDAMPGPSRVDVCREFIEHEARVVAVDDDSAWVEAQRANACGHCGAGGACGVSTVSKMIRLPNPRLRVPRRLGADDAPLQIGDGVVVGVPESALLKAALSAYLLPLLLILGGGLVGQAFAGSDVGAVAGAVLLPLVVLPLWRRARARRPGQPVYVLRRQPEQAIPLGVAMVEWPPRA